MELEFHQLDLKNEGLKLRDAREEGRLRRSLEESGQLSPVIVVRGPDDDGRYVLVDGFRRVRALQRLGRDTVDALVLESGEATALVTAHHLLEGGRRSALEDGYLIRTLRSEHGMSLDEIGRRLGHGKSWVSRRLGLVKDLPEWLQSRVCEGAIPCHAAVRFLLPLARANRADGEGLAKSIEKLGLSSRQVGSLYEAWKRGDVRARRLVVEQPQVVLRALAVTEDADWGRPEDDGEHLATDLEKVASLSRRASATLGRVLLSGMHEDLRVRVSRTWRKVCGTWDQIAVRLEEEGVLDERPGGPAHGAGAGPCGPGEASDRPAAPGVQGLREGGAGPRDGGSPGA